MGDVSNVRFLRIDKGVLQMKGNVQKELRKRKSQKKVQESRHSLHILLENQLTKPLTTSNLTILIVRMVIANSKLR
jgi:hypothetical protein